MTYGEKLVGIKFNPSNQSAVADVKSLFAEVANILVERRDSNENTTEMNEMLFDHAITELLNAQMNAVKYLTFEY